MRVWNAAYSSKHCLCTEWVMWQGRSTILSPAPKSSVQIGHPPRSFMAMKESIIRLRKEALSLLWISVEVLSGVLVIPVPMGCPTGAIEMIWLGFV